MASVTFNTIIFTLVSDPTQSLVLSYVTGISGGPVNSGEDRQYGTRIRGVNTGVTVQSRAVTAEAVEPADVATLCDVFAGESMCYRDPNGAKYFGTFRTPAVTWHNYDTGADVSLTFTQQTYDESV